MIESVTGGKQHKATIPVDVPVNRLLPLLIQKLGLLSHNDTGRRISYRLLHRESGSQLRDSDTLQAAGVSDGHNLKILAEVIAGI